MAVNIEGVGLELRYYAQRKPSLTPTDFDSSATFLIATDASDR